MAATLAVHRSRICERWWLVGYFTTGRDIGSAVPYGANPFPMDSENATGRDTGPDDCSEAGQKFRLSINSCRRVCG